MDTAADPCDDFYQYACGRWNLKNSIPEDRSGFDTFEMLRDNLEVVLRDLLLEPDDPSENETAIDKTKILFRSCMNEGKNHSRNRTIHLFFYETELIEKLGTQPLLDLIESLGGWPVLDPNWNETAFDWIEMTSDLRLYYNDVLIMFWVGQDLASSINIIQVS